MRQLLAALLALLPSLAFAQVPWEKAIDTMVVAPDLQIELFAHEPDLINPTSIDVDHLGRVWVCEAVNYRCYLRKIPLFRPEGDRIVILEDTKGAGKADKVTVFYQGKEIIAPIGIAVAPLASGVASAPRGSGDKQKLPALTQPGSPAQPGSPKACRVFVCQSPDILVFDDLDGDGKADGPPKKFLTGFGGFDHDHGVHGINIGPDGKLYFTVGDQGVHGLQSSDGKGRKWFSNSTDCRAGTVWRCDIDGKNLELIAHNFRNNYECCVNSFGEIWLSDNDDDGNQQTRICYVMPGGDYGYHPRGPGQSHWHEEQPGIVHKVLRTGFGSPTGICFYEGNLLPKRFHGQLLHTDAGPREFRAFHIKPKGAGYELEKEILVTSKDSWFRLSDVCVAPDGSVFLADWYDPGVGGHGMGDTTRGRIYRVTPKGHVGYKVPKVGANTLDGLKNAFLSPNLATRYIATRELKRQVTLIRDAWRARDTVLPKELKETAVPWDRLAEAIRVPKATTPDYARWYWATCVDNSGTENRTPLLRPHDLIREDKNDAVRDQLLCAALRIDRDNGNEFFFDPFDLLKSEVNGVESTLALAKTKDIDRALSYCGATPAARRELLITIRALEPHFAASVFYPLAKLYDGQDHFYRAALNIACGTDPKRRAAILADFNKHFPEWNDKVADLVWELRPKSVLPRLEKLLADAKLSDAQKGRIVDILAVNDDPAAGKSLLALLRSNPPAAVRDRALENLRLFLPTKWKGLAGGPEMKQIIVELLARDETRVIGLQLIAVDRRPEWAEMAGAIALDKQAPAALRGEAIRTLGKLDAPEAVKALGNVALDDAELAPAAIEAIGRHLVAGNRDSDAANLALKFLQEVILLEKLTPESRAALSALGGSQAGSAWLLNQKERGLLPEALAADTGRLLRNSPFQPIRNKAMLLFPPPGKLDPAKLPAIPVLAKRTGDVGRGKRLLAASVKSEAQCLKCHTIRGVGGQIGPDLSMIGKKASRENLLESILLPSKAIADQYLQYQIETKSGQQVMGLIVAQDASAVTLRDANGKDYTFNRRDIESMTKSQVSIMPADIVKALSEDELLDVVEYLLTLRTPSLTPEFWHIVGPFPNDEKDSGLDTVYEPEKKVDLSATYKASRERQRPENARQRPELTWTKVTRNADGYVDLVAHYAGHSVNIMSYVYREIEAPADGEATISLGTDDGAKLWVNGEKVYETRAHDAATPDKAKVTVKLKKGVNTLLMKIVNGNNPHGFYLTIVSEQELKAGK